MDIEIQLTDSVSATEQAAIKRTTLNIARSQRGTIPYMRDVGTEDLLPENNSPENRRACAADIAEQISEWEERAEVKDVAFTEEHKMKVVMGIE